MKNLSNYNNRLFLIRCTGNNVNIFGDAFAYIQCVALDFINVRGNLTSKFGSRNYLFHHRSILSYTYTYIGYSNYTSQPAHWVGS